MSTLNNGSTSHRDTEVVVEKRIWGWPHRMTGFGAKVRILKEEAGHPKKSTQFFRRAKSREVVGSSKNTGLPLYPAARLCQVWMSNPMRGLAAFPQSSSQLQAAVPDLVTFSAYQRNNPVSPGSYGRPRMT